MAAEAEASSRRAITMSIPRATAWSWAPVASPAHQSARTAHLTLSTLTAETQDFLPRTIVVAVILIAVEQAVMGILGHCFILMLVLVVLEEAVAELGPPHFAMIDNLTRPAQVTGLNLTFLAP